MNVPVHKKKIVTSHSYALHLPVHYIYQYINIKCRGQEYPVHGEFLFFFNFLFSNFAGDQPCLGTRTGPNLEYQWMTYKEVRIQNNTLK